MQHVGGAVAQVLNDICSRTSLKQRHLDAIQAFLRQRAMKADLFEQLIRVMDDCLNSNKPDENYTTAMTTLHRELMH